MFMKKFIRMAAMLTVAGAALLTSCTKDYSEDISALQSKVASLEQTISSIQGQIANGAILTAVNKTANGVQIVTTAGSYEITNGKDGDDGKPGSVVTIDKNGYWCIDGKATEYKAAVDPAPKCDGITAVVEEGKLTLKGVEGGEGEEKIVVISLNGKIGYISVIPCDTEIGEYYHSPYWGDYPWVEIINVTEKENVFGPEGGDKITFVKGKTINKGSDLLLRVSPVTASFEAEDIKFLNSKGEILDYVFVEKVEKYDSLLLYFGATKASMNSGLYKVTVNLKEGVSMEDFNKATWAEGYRYNEEEPMPILFAATIDDAISGYDVCFSGESDEDICGHDLYINDTIIDKIHNRYEACDDETPTRKQELVWKDYKPDTKITDKNVWGQKADGSIISGTDYQDNRQNESILSVVCGKEIKIEFKDPTVKAFYVELDERNALESDPSEINAWKSYQYENLNKLQMGSKGSITIVNTNNVAGDIIGFRVYSANLDGTLCDPDGRAFYVYVSSEYPQTSLSVEINAANRIKGGTQLSAVSERKALNGLKAAELTSEWEKVTFDPADACVFDVKFFEKEDSKTALDPKDWNKAKFFEVSAHDISEYYDGATYVQKLTCYKNVGTGVSKPITQVINLSVTKVMPTEAKPVQFRPKQETEDGSGIFKAYMIPWFDKDAEDLADQQAQYTIENDGKRFAPTGTKDFNNVFYGLDENYVFTVANVVKKDKKYDQPAEVKFTENTVTGLTYGLVVDSVLIDDTTMHAVKVAYNYGPISLVKPSKADEIAEPKDYTVSTDQDIKVIFSCWHFAETYSWRVDKNSKGEITKDYTPELQWTAEGKGDEAKFYNIIAENSYNNDFFGDMTLGEILDLEWVELTSQSELIYTPASGEPQKNPYFVPSVVDEEGRLMNKVVFTQVNTQVDSAPVAPHMETLNIYVKDAFGHVKAISTEVKVLEPGHSGYNPVI